MYHPFFYDSTYILVLIGVAVSMIASAKLNPTYQRYPSMHNMYSFTDAKMAQKPLNNQGIYSMTARRVTGNLTGHYDPKTKAVNLSDSVYSSTPVTAVDVAAHECGHAMQDTSDYLPPRIRVTLVPAANLDSNLVWPLILIDLLPGGDGSTLANIGILLFSLAVLLQLATLPVEHNASYRAVALLDSIGILSGQEMRQIRSMLSAATLIYMVAAAASILQLLRLLMTSGNRRND